MKIDLIAAIGILTLVIAFSISPKVGGVLIAVVVLGMLLQITRQSLTNSDLI